jgi:hypothetical protein
MSILDNMKAALSKGLKDPLVSQGVRFALNRFVEKYATIQEFHLDSARSTLTAAVLLKGESSPILVTVDGYEVREREGETYLVITGVTTSKEWLTELLRDKVVNQSLFKVPEEYRWLIEKLV